MPRNLFLVTRKRLFFILFQGENGNSNSASLKPSHQSNKCLYTAFFHHRNEHKQRRNVKKATRDKLKQLFFVVARKNFEIFAVHVCFNLKLAAKQQHSHCFRAQCLMRGCQLTEVFLVNSERERVLRQRLHEKKQFFSCVVPTLPANFTSRQQTRSESFIVLDDVTVCNYDRRARQTINCHDWDEITFIQK